MEESKIIFEGRPSWLNYAAPLAVAALMVLGSFKMPGLLVFVVVIIAVVALKRRGCYAKVTNSRIITKFGVASTKTYEIDIKDIRSINVSQGLLQKIFRLGTLEFATASGPVKEAAIVGISKPEGLKERIRELKIE
jgi:uncharacterized membrane protein YdbT with pleckstrin-like domain